MKKWVGLIVITVAALLCNYVFAEAWGFHPSFVFMVLFFSAQTFVLFRLDALVPKRWSVELSLVKIILRFLLSAVCITVLIYTQEDSFSLVIQFIALYFVFMIFEIVTSLTNLRRN